MEHKHQLIMHQEKSVQTAKKSVESTNMLDGAFDFISGAKVTEAESLVFLSFVMTVFKDPLV